MNEATEPISVLWVISRLGAGGAETVLATHARYADHQRFGYSLAYLAAGDDRIVTALADNGVTVRRLGTGLWWPLRLWARLWRGRYDVVHTHSPLPAGVARILVRLLPRSRRPRLMATAHHEWRRMHRLTRFVHRISRRWAGLTLADSQSVADTLRGVDDVRIVPHGVDVAAVRAEADRGAVRNELGIPEDAWVVGTVAGLRPDKGYDVLLRAARRLLVEGGTGRHAWFVAVGEGPARESLCRLHDDLGLGDRFRFIGFRSDARRVMSGFDVFCLPSRREGLPIALREAAALGLPLVATDVGGVAEVLGDGDRLVPPDDVDALARALAEPPDAPSAAVRDAADVTAEVEAIYRDLRDGVIG